MTYGIIFRLVSIGAMIMLAILLPLILALGHKFVAKIKSLKHKKPQTGVKEGLLQGAIGRLENASGFLGLPPAKPEEKDKKAFPAAWGEGTGAKP